MDEVAEAAAHTTLAAVEPTARLAEVGDGTQLAVDWARSIPSRIEVIAGFLGGLLVLESRVHVADQVVVVVVAHDELL